MQYNVVYILGAGFSVPLGIPAVGNFLEKAKDQYFHNSDRYSYFKQIFSIISDMAVAKNYYAIDLFNVEEVLSILEMQERLSDSPEGSDFKKFIADVIKHHTPECGARVSGRTVIPELFCEEPWGNYCAFIAALFGQGFKILRSVDGPNSISYLPVADAGPTTNYSVITLNYDLVVETCVKTINANHNLDLKLSRYSELEPPGKTIRYAKMHGSIGGEGEIIPPTWNKGLHRESILNDWKIAFNALSNAHHIRVIGYSLPKNDSYIRYLFHSAAIASQHHHLKTFDVLCLDPSEEAERRFREFINFPNLRFRSARTEDYLRAYVDCLESWPEVVTGAELEQSHAKFFNALT